MVGFPYLILDISHRIHGAGIYANIGGILMVHVTIYSSTMDPMGYYLSNHCRLYPSNPRRWFHRPPQRSTVPLEAALPQEPTKTVLFPGLADWNICTCSSTGMSKIYMYYLHCIYLICKFQIGMCTHTQYIYICNIVPDVPINYNVYIYICIIPQK